MNASVGLAPKLTFAFAAHGLVALIGIVTAPVYLHLLGADGYGLVGFYVVLQGWMLVLDFGLAPTVARQLSQFRAGKLEPKNAAGLVQGTEAVFLAVAFLVALIFLTAAEPITKRWLGASKLAPEEIIRCVRLLGFVIAARWMAVLYHSALTGLERQNTLNGIILTGAAARALASVSALLYVSTAPRLFFTAQLAITVVETLACRAVLMTDFSGALRRFRPAWSSLLGEGRFAAALAATSAITVAVNQADKLALSHYLPLGEFGLFSLVVAICGGITMMTPPLTQMIYPRLTVLLAQDRRPDFFNLYRLSSSLMIVIAISIAGTIALHPGLVLLAWTGVVQSHRLEQVLSLYAGGTGLSIYAVIPYLLQFAHGKVRLHLIGSIAFGALWIPAALFSAASGGAVGTGIVWLLGNALFTLIWLPIVHQRFLTTEERQEFRSRTALGTATTAAVVIATITIPGHGMNRLEAFVVLGAVALVTAFVGVLAFADLRAYALATTRTTSGRLRLRS